MRTLSTGIKVLAIGLCRPEPPRNNQNGCCAIALIEILVTREVEALILLLVDKLDIHMALQVSSHLIY